MREPEADHGGGEGVCVLLRREVAPTAAAAAILLAVVIADAATARATVLVSLVVTAPLLTAAFTRPGVTAAVAGAAVLAALLRLPWDAQGATDVVRVTSISASSVLAVFIARRREDRERDLSQMTRVADVAQSAVLWPVPPRVRDLDFTARYVSATASARIGGDLYEVVDSRFGVRLIVGDVRGHGLPAVRLAAAVLGCFREAAHDREDLQDVVVALNATVARLAGPEDFVTAAVLQLDGGSGQIMSCGHPAPLRSTTQSSGTLDVETSDLPLGLGAGQGSTPTSFTLPPGGRLLLHTDGLLEGRDAAGDYFPAGTCFAALAQVHRTEVLDALLGQLTDWCGGHIADDVALLLVERSG